MYLLKIHNLTAESPVVISAVVASSSTKDVEEPPLAADVDMPLSVKRTSNSAEATISKHKTQMRGTVLMIYLCSPALGKTAHCLTWRYGRATSQCYCNLISRLAMQFIADFLI